MFKGLVCLIGAGPGQTGLITRQGMGYLRRADTILFDHLVSTALLLETKPFCELIEVGKEGGKASWHQEDINVLMAEKAREGRFVVRLKGGDPFLFGRGGEEAEYLASAGIPFVMVPGISSSYAAPAYAGIPVTDRRYGPGLIVRSGSRSVMEQEHKPTDTMVILMTLARLTETVNELMAQGYSADAPVSLISRGTTPFQQSVTGRLSTIQAMAEEANLPTPAMMVVGDVVRLQAHLNWRENLPLTGRRILSTRPASKAKSLIWEELELLGAEVVHFPTIEIQPFQNETIQGMLPEIKCCDWLVLSSAAAVEILYEALIRRGEDWRYFADLKIAVIGEATARVLKDKGRIPELISREGSSRGMLDTLLKHVEKSDEIALCRARQALPVLAQGLAASGIDYRQFDLYDVAAVQYPPAMVRRIFADPFDLAVFASPSSVRNFRDILEGSGAVLQTGVQTACLGRETGDELRRCGIEPWIVSDKPDVEALIDQVLQEWGVDVCFRRQG